MGDDNAADEGFELDNAAEDGGADGQLRIVLADGSDGASGRDG